MIVGIAALDTVWRGGDRAARWPPLLRVTARSLRLFEQARTAARSCGAGGLYISATPSENTVHFYQRRGALLLRTPDAELFAKEPDDIHLECPV